ncbi:helix-turn-helix domain-containing protein [Propionibacterium sp.]|uniref:helix-turn-helix domain-containing protein n=1 Tax=Propionibacterium sp. TaxID=1977903 RepID=UPI00345EC3CA
MKPPLLRVLLGQTLRDQRIHDRRTLRDVSLAARVSLGYLSEVERGQKEASSELLFSICQALNVPLSEILREVSEKMLVVEAGQLQASRIGLEAAAPSVIAA